MHSRQSPSDAKPIIHIYSYCKREPLWAKQNITNYWCDQLFDIKKCYEFKLEIKLGLVLIGLFFVLEFYVFEITTNIAFSCVINREWRAIDKTCINI